METSTPTTEFFKAGGTLPDHAPSYVQRPADDLLFTQVTAGQLCYVLTPRQMGKSSLMIRTVARLQATGVHTAIVDLSALGVHVSSGQWYLGILTILAGELRLKTDVQAWWQARASLGVVQRFTDFINDVVLAQIKGRIVVFFDEIDSTLSLDFTDDFFAAIRVMYNLRASDSDYDRLTFVLLGVAAPADLSKDRNRTPFNVGQAIDLKEFIRADAQPLAAGLAAVYPDQGNQLLDRVFDWTSGHPYLTQKICSTLVSSRQNGDTQPHAAEVVDRCVTKLFLADEATSEANLQFVQSRVKAYPDVRSLLQLYRRVYQGEMVGEDRRSPRQNELRLIGLVDARQGSLQVRNEIYRRVFDLAWVKTNTPINWPRVVTIGALAVSMVAIIAAIGFQQWQTNRQIEALSQRFNAVNDHDIKLLRLADVCGLRPEAGRQLFFHGQLNPEEQRDLLRYANLQIEIVNKSMATALPCLDPELAEHPEQQAALCHVICETRKKLSSGLATPADQADKDACQCGSK